jgi:excisionase family DNA binding protein
MGRPAEALTYTIPEAAEALRVSPSTVKRRIEDGTFPIVRIGGRTLIPRIPLEQWIEDHIETVAS